MDAETVMRPRERVEGQWLVLAYSNNPLIRLDGCLLDRIMADDSELIFEVDNVRVGLHLTEADPRAIAEALAIHTRTGPIRSREAYDYAVRRAALAKSGSRDHTIGLQFGAERAYLSGECFYVGEFVCLIEDVVRYSEAGAALQLPNGKMQAVLAMILVVDQSRTENLETLSRRIAEFELSVQRV
jgi:hypothetical protein